jgi:plastocyanin
MVRRILMIVVLAVAPGVASAAALVVSVRDVHGAPLDDAVVYAIPLGRRVSVPSKPAVMDQKNRQFVPRLLVIQTGTAVSFPNSDNVRHQVYSFSPAKKFQLPLYEGTPSAPIVFDKAGVVTLGCNIHDRMSAWIVIVDTPHFAVAEKGRAALTDLPVGNYDVMLWHPGQRDAAPGTRVALAAGETRELTVTPGSE